MRHLGGGTEALEVRLDRDIRSWLYPLHDVYQGEPQIGDPLPDRRSVRSGEQAGLGIPARSQGDFGVLVADAGNVSEAFHIGERTHAIKAVAELVRGPLRGANVGSTIAPQRRRPRRSDP